MIMTRVQNITQFKSEFAMSGTIADNHSASNAELAAAYAQKISRLSEISGSAYAVERYKKYYLFCRNISLDLPLPAPIPFCRTDKRGIPRDIKPLVPLLTGPPEDRRVGLTIARFYESIYCRPNPDLGAIRNPCTGVDIDDEFKEFVMMKIPHIARNVRSPSKFKVINRLVAGPNGPAMLTAHYDALALKDSGLLDRLSDLKKICPT